MVHASWPDTRRGCLHYCGVHHYCTGELQMYAFNRLCKPCQNVLAACMRHYGVMGKPATSHRDTALWLCCWSCTPVVLAELSVECAN